MTDGLEAQAERWSAVAGEWSALWGEFAGPARRALIAATGVVAGSRVLDVGCGSGEFLLALDGVGARVAGVDPAPAMLSRARMLVPSADLRPAGAESLPWPDGAFDVVMAVNALQFADDPVAALRELARVTAPGGSVGVANWAEADRNDLDTIERALAEDDGEAFGDDPDYRRAGGLEAWFAAAGLEVAASGEVAAPWEAPDDATLVRGVLLGEDAERMAASAPVVLGAAAGFRAPGGGYRLENAFRWVVGR